MIALNRRRKADGVQENLADSIYLGHLDICTARNVVIRPELRRGDDSKVDTALGRHTDPVLVFFGFNESGIKLSTLLVGGVTGGVGSPDVDVDVFVADAALQVSRGRRGSSNTDRKSVV